MPGIRVAPDRWFDEIRARILTLVGCPGAQAILCASGTETEILALTLARSLLRRPLTNIVVAQQETGAGVMQAAAGTHFDVSAALQANVEKGRPLEGWQPEAIETANVDIRDLDGRLRASTDVDQDVGNVIADAMQRGRDIQLHVLDTSKVGQGGPSRSVAKTLSTQHPERIIVVVDACQLRCSFEDIRADLTSGFMVMITGSKFAGGPPFCGALLIPKGIGQKLDHLEVPAGLAAYSAQHDWPSRFRPALRGDCFALSNLGLGLRWEAALAEMELFGDRVCAEVASRPHMSFLDGDPRTQSDRAATMFPIVSGSGDPAQASRIHRALREPIADLADGSDADILLRRCQMGQPVVIGSRSALRVCIGMPTISSVASRLKQMSLQDSMSPVFSDLEIMFRKWDLLEKRGEQ